MKNIYIMLLLCAVPCIAHAADTMCVKPTTTVVVLDPAINGTALSSAVTGKTWSTEFSYGIISGVGACSSSGGNNGVITPSQDLSPYGSSSSGLYCSCKLLKPVESRWVVNAYMTGCNDKCASSCASTVGSTASLRRGLFGSIILP